MIMDGVSVVRSEVAKDTLSSIRTKVYEYDHSINAPILPLRAKQWLTESRPFNLVKDFKTR